MVVIFNLRADSQTHILFLIHTMYLDLYLAVAEESRELWYKRSVDCLESGSESSDVLNELQLSD